LLLSYALSVHHILKNSKGTFIQALFAATTRFSIKSFFMKIALFSLSDRVSCILFILSHSGIKYLIGDFLIEIFSFKNNSKIYEKFKSDNGNKHNKSDGSSHFNIVKIVDVISGFNSRIFDSNLVIDVSACDISENSSIDLDNFNISCKLFSLNDSII
jgi:hypothetical protein